MRSKLLITSMVPKIAQNILEDKFEDNIDNEVLYVSQGKLTLEQMKQIFKHLQVSLAYIDENGVLKFYNDSIQRLPPKKLEAIGKKTQNYCNFRSQEF